MRLSVVICTYNRARLLEGALAALRAQAVGPGLAWDITVVDNNSNDRTKDVAEAFSATMPVPMRYLFEGRQGKTFALNSGIEAATGDILALTDDDCRPATTWVQDLADAFTRWDADGVGGRILAAWSSEPPAWLARDPHLWDRIALLGDAEPRRVRLGPWEREHGMRVWGANMAFRRTVFASVGGFDVTMGPRGSKHHMLDDVEFVRRVVAAGHTVVFDPQPTVRHWVGPDRLRKRYFRTHAFHYGEGSALKQGLPRSYHVLGVPPHLVLLAGRRGAAWARAALSRDPDAFCRQLDLIEALGHVSGYCRAAVRARRYLSLRRAAS